MRWRICREKKNEEHTENEKKFPLKTKVYKTYKSFGKAFTKFFTSLANSPQKRKAVVGGPAKLLG